MWRDTPDRGYRAVLIEADAERAALLARAHPGGDVIAMQAMVGTQGPTSLDALLGGTPIPAHIDLLSIDLAAGSAAATANR